MARLFCVDVTWCSLVVTLALFLTNSNALSTGAAAHEYNRAVVQEVTVDLDHSATEHERGETWQAAAGPGSTQQTSQAAKDSEQLLERAYEYDTAATIYKNQGNPERAEELYEKALAIFEQFGREYAIADTAAELGKLYANRKALRQAVEMHRKAAAAFDGAGFPDGAASSYFELSLVYGELGKLDKAESADLKALALLQAYGDTQRLAEDYSYRGEQFLLRKEFIRAEKMFQVSLTLHEWRGDKAGMATVQRNRAAAHHELGQIERACTGFHGSRNLFADLGLQEDAAAVDDLIFRAACWKPTTSMKTYFDGKSFAELETEAGEFKDLGMGYFQERNWRLAGKLLAKALPIYEHLGKQQEIGTVANMLGIVYRHLKIPDPSVELHRRAIEAFSATGADDDVALNYLHLGIDYSALKDVPQACENWKIAIGLLLKQGLNKDAKLVRGWRRQVGC